MNETRALVFPSRSGAPTARLGSITLHSVYDPLKEARRFLEERFPSAPSVLLIVEPGLGHLARAAAERFPGCLVLSAFCDPSLAKLGGFEPAPDVWHPARTQSLDEFLNERIPEHLFPGFAIASWPVIRDAYPETSERILNVVAAWARIMNGNLTTNSYFARRWIRNALHRFLSVERIVRPDRIGGPAFIAAAGPSLEDSLEALLPLRERFTLVALASSLLTLDRFGLVPDVIVLTDASYWASLQLHVVERNIRSATDNAWRTVPTASPLTACRSRQAGALLVLDQGSFVETELFSRLDAPRVRIPEAGTVAATALHLCRALGLSPIVFAGLDFCCRDTLEHARPHPFDALLAGEAERRRPAEGAALDRIRRSAPDRIEDGGRIYRTGRSLRTYAEWFSLRKLPDVYRLDPSPIPVPSMTKLDADALRKLASGFEDSPSRASTDQELPDLSVRKRICLSTLNAWKQTLQSEGTSSPTLASDRILYACAPREFLSGRRNDVGNPDTAYDMVINEASGRDDVARVSALSFIGDLLRRVEAFA